MRKNRTSHEIEPILKGYVSWKSTRNTSWVWARQWWAWRGHAPTLTLMYHTGVDLPKRMSVQLYTPSCGRE